MKKIILTCAAVCLCLMAAAQNFDGILSEIESNNTTLKALRAETDAAKLEARTGLTPDDPELGLGYLWGTPSDQGNRLDISLTQTFDFPTVYYYKSKIASGEADVAEYEYAAGRRSILIEANRLCIEAVYRNALAKTLERRVRSAETIAGAWRRKYDSGETGALDLNKAELNLVSAKKEARTNDIELQAILAELARMNGGTSVKIDADGFLGGELPSDFDSWYANAEASNPELQAISGRVENSRRGIKLAQAEWLPKLSIGYDSERIAGTTLQGIAGGISIPLWAGKGRVKAAKAKAGAMEARLLDASAQFRLALMTKYRQALGLQDVVREYREKVNASASLEMLQKSLEAGEISLVDFVLEQNLWYDAVSEALESERDFQLISAELNRYSR